MATARHPGIDRKCFCEIDEDVYENEHAGAGVNVYADGYANAANWELKVSKSRPQLRLTL